MMKKGKSKITITIPYRLYILAMEMSAITATLAVLSALGNHSPLWVILMTFLVVVSIITTVWLMLAEKDNRYDRKT
jgi:hypothetical protein